jgi:hypothetical protein
MLPPSDELNLSNLPLATLELRAAALEESFQASWRRSLPFGPAILSTAEHQCPEFSGHSHLRPSPARIVAEAGCRDAEGAARALAACEKVGC